LLPDFLQGGIHRFELFACIARVANQDHQRSYFQPSLWIAKKIAKTPKEMLSLLFGMCSLITGWFLIRSEFPASELLSVL
jgi:hypothetical protein